MTLDERLSLLWKTLQKLTPEEIDKELDGAQPNSDCDPGNKPQSDNC